LGLFVISACKSEVGARIRRAETGGRDIISPRITAQTECEEPIGWE